MAIRKFISKEISIRGSEYVGHPAEVWIDDDGTRLRVGDGVTPGGINVVDGLANNGNSVVLGTNGVLSVPGSISLPNTTTISGNSIIVGEDAASPYWYSTLNGTTLPAATVASATAPVGGPPVVTLTGQQPAADRSRVRIVGAIGMTGLNDYWYTKATNNANEYELWDNYDLDAYTDLSGEDPYVANSASLSYYGYQAVTQGVAHDANGNVFTSGYTESQGDDRAFVAKYSSTGTLLWQRVFEDSQNLSGWGMAVDPSGNAFAVVNDEERIHIVKLNGATGALMFQNAITSPTGEYGYYCEIASDGHVVLGGRIYDAVTGTDDFLLAKVSSTDGTLIWSKQLGTTVNEEAFGVACDPRGPITVVGAMYDDTDTILVARYESDGTLIWQKTIANVDPDYSVVGVDVAIDSRGNAYLAASTSFAEGPGESAALVIKLNTAGTVQWTRKIGPGACYTVGLSIAVDSNDKIYMLAANGQQTTDVPQFDFVLACYDANGAVQWQRY